MRFQEICYGLENRYLLPTNLPYDCQGDQERLKYSYSSTKKQYDAINQGYKKIVMLQESNQSQLYNKVSEANFPYLHFYKVRSNLHDVLNATALREATT